MVRFSIECGVKVTRLGDRLILRLKKGRIKKKKKKERRNQGLLLGLGLGSIIVDLLEKNQVLEESRVPSGP